MFIFFCLGVYFLLYIYLLISTGGLDMVILVDPFTDTTKGFIFVLYEYVHKYAGVTTLIEVSQIDDLFCFWKNVFIVLQTWDFWVIIFSVGGILFVLCFIIILEFLIFSEMSRRFVAESGRSMMICVWCFALACCCFLAYLAYASKLLILTYFLVITSAFIFLFVFFIICFDVFK